eukprot:4676715-Amphidinium_carterae.1
MNRSSAYHASGAKSRSVARASFMREIWGKSHSTVPSGVPSNRLTPLPGKTGKKDQFDKDGKLANTSRVMNWTTEQAFKDGTERPEWS